MPVLRPHRRFGRDGRTRSLRIAAGAATDGRDLARLGVPKACGCGAVDPSRHHLTFECPQRPWTADRRTEQERRLLCAVVEDAGYVVEESVDEEEQVGALAELLSVAGDGILVATDGGAKQLGEHFRWRCASWAVAVESRSFSGLVQGEEKTAARVNGPLFACCAKRPRWPNAKFAFWWTTSLLCRAADAGGIRSRGRTSCGPFGTMWVRLYLFLKSAGFLRMGKKGHWRPPLMWPEAALCRALNDAADSAATARLRQLERWWAGLDKAVEEAEEWSWKALQTQLEATDAWHAKLKEIMQARRSLRRFAGHAGL